MFLAPKEYYLHKKDFVPQSEWVRESEGDGAQIHNNVCLDYSICNFCDVGNILLKFCRQVL
jgi:hypothetical protein